MHHVYLGLGANIGDREATIRQAVRLIGERVGQVVRQSALIETEPWGFQSENAFLNGVVLVETELAPRSVLKLTQDIEHSLGRTSKSSPSMGYHDRPIDIDILLYDDLTISEPDLQIPHPLMTQREFVMKPLSEINHHLLKQ